MKLNNKFGLDRMSWRAFIIAIICALSELFESLSHLVVAFNYQRIIVIRILNRFFYSYGYFNASVGFKV